MSAARNGWMSHPPKQPKTSRCRKGTKKEIKFFTRAIGARHQFGDLTSFDQIRRRSHWPAPRRALGQLSGVRSVPDGSQRGLAPGSLLCYATRAARLSARRSRTTSSGSISRSLATSWLTSRTRRGAARSKSSFYAGLTGKARPAADKVIEDSQQVFVRGATPRSRRSSSPILPTSPGECDRVSCSRAAGSRCLTGRYGRSHARRAALMAENDPSKASSGRRSRRRLLSP